MSGENLALIGPSGTAKSELARIVAAALVPSRVISCHRDLRAAELLGDERLERQLRGGREVLRTLRQPGLFASARCVVLDDLARAPTALRANLTGRIDAHPNVLWLSTLGSRELYAEPLEAGLLDRFPLQVRMRGLLERGNWSVARQLIGSAPLECRASLAVASLESARAAAQSLAVAGGVAQALAAVLQKIDRRLDGEGLGDRLARSIWNLLRAHAWLRRAPRVSLQDLNVLRFALDARLTAEAQLDLDASDLFDDSFEAPPRLSTASAGSAGLGQTGATREFVPHRAARRDRELPPLRTRSPLPPAADVEVLKRAFGGSQQRGGSERREHPGGSPRSFRPWRRGDGFDDADPLDLVRYSAGDLPHGPRVLRRERNDAGGSVLVLRDVSASMEGRLERWASQAVAGIVRLAARRNMRIGYVEFNDQTTAFRLNGRLFHRRYSEVLDASSRGVCEGQTTLAAPLALALDAFENHPARAGRHVVLITDGLPVLGDPELGNEQARLCNAQIQVHTVFLGLGPRPPLLETLATTTQGHPLTPIPTPNGNLSLSLTA